MNTSANGQFIRDLWRAMGLYRSTLAVGLTCAAVAGVFDAIGPWLLKKGVDSLRANVQLEWLYLFSSLIVFTSLIGGWFRFLMRDKVIGVSRFVEGDLRDSYFRKLLHLPPAFFDRNHTGDLMTRATEDVERMRMVLGPALLYAVNTVLTIIFSAAMMMALDLNLALWILSLAPVIGTAVLLVARSLHRANLLQQETYSRLSNHVQENLTGFRVVKAFVREDIESHRFKDVCQEYFRRSMNVVRAQAAFQPLLALLIGLGTAGILWLGGHRIAAGAMSLGSFIAFMGYLSLMTWPMMALGWITHLYQRGTASHERFKAVMNEVPQFSLKRVQALEKDGIVSAPSLTLQNLTMRYHTEGRAALDSVTLSVPAGATIAIVGKVGSGKSSLGRVIARLYPPESGEVLFNGTNWTELDVRSLREAIGYVDQTPFLFSTTIRDNITLGDPDASADRIWDAAHVADFDEVIRDLPDGLLTVIGERGITLSGGQQQRLTLARALLKDPPVLILDDALSAVDADTEAAILERLRSRTEGRTTLFITHRLAAAEKADLIAVLEQGRIVETGRHEDLVKAGGVYEAMYRRQRISEELGSLA